MTLACEFQQYIQQHKLFKKAETILVGVSGGTDSVALLELLLDARRQFGWKLIVAHFDHRLRTGSDRDASFVAGLAKKNGLPAEMGKGRKRRTGASEQEARLERFAFLAKACKKHKADAIALAHTRDDLAETVLMRLIRGGGTKGLAAIRPRRMIKDAWFVRPLLFASRRQLSAYVKSHKLKFREDPTNKQKKFFRNRVRLELLPLLEKKYNPNIKTILAQTADNAALDYDFLLQAAGKIWPRLCRAERSGSIGITAALFKKQHPAMQRMLLRLSLEKLRGDTRQITYRHLESLRNLILDLPSGSVVSLPKRMRARKMATSIRLYISKS